MIPTSQQKAFLDMLAVSELGKPLLAASDNGYNVMVTSTADHPILFDSYACHPNRTMDVKDKNGRLLCKSTAAGRYQALARYARAYMTSLHLPDFSPASQDAIALQQIKEAHALADIEMGNVLAAIAKCAHLWASLPGANYKDQHMNTIAALQTAFTDAGGRIA